MNEMYTNEYTNNPINEPKPESASTLATSSSTPPPCGACGKPNQGKAIAAMVLGIVSVVGCFGHIFVLPTAVTGLILSIISLKRQEEGRGMAIAGLVTSIVALAIVIIFVIFFVLFILAVEVWDVFPTHPGFYDTHIPI